MSALIKKKHIDFNKEIYQLFKSILDLHIIFRNWAGVLITKIKSIFTIIQVIQCLQHDTHMLTISTCI